MTQLSSLKSRLTKVRRAAFAPIDSASLVFFRIAFGVLMMWEVYHYFKEGRIQQHWLEPRFLFTYYGFSWVRPFPGNGLYIAWGALGVFAFFIAIGFLYRFSAVLFFVGITYFFLLDQAKYLNHFYLMCLLSMLLTVVPVNRFLAVDSLLRLTTPSQTMPAWPLWLFRFQMATVYFYSGVAKFSYDWLHGEPMRAWIAGRTDIPILGRFIDEPWMPYFLSYGGLLLDLLIVPFLLWRRTRLVAFSVTVMFHFWNMHMFTIGVFPALATAATTLFFSPSWPRRVLSILRRKKFVQVTSAAESPVFGQQVVILTLLGVYVLVQSLLPFRHLLYPGGVDWTYEGQRFSWRMKLHDREGRAVFYVTDPNNGTEVAVNPHRLLRSRQAKKMMARPDMIVQFAHYLATVMPRAGPKPLRVEARIFLSLNGRKPSLFVNPTVDLAAEPRRLTHAPWLLPLTEPLPDPVERAQSSRAAVATRDADLARQTSSEE